MKRTRIVLLLVVASIVAAPWTEAQTPKMPEIISFDTPSAGTGAFQGTFAYAINAAGAVTGWYLDAGNQAWGFRRTPSGAITSFSVPNVGTGPFLGTGPWSINSQGAIAGYYVDMNCVEHGFVRDLEGKVTEFDAPGAGTTPSYCVQFNPFVLQGSAALDINARGEIAGLYLDANSVYHCFLRAPDGTITACDVPSAGSASYQGTYPAAVSGLNSAGTLAGTFLDSQSAYHSFLRLGDGTLVTFEAQGAGTNQYQGTYANSINSGGEIVGVYFDANSVQHGFLRAPDGTITSFDVPGAGGGVDQGTVAEANNDTGITTGNYIDAQGVNHGFVRGVDGKITTFDAPGAGSGSGQGTIPVAISSQEAITGYYIDANDASHGFLRLPDPPGK